MDNKSKFLTPISLWKAFDGSLPLKTTKISEVRFDNAVYGEYYFSAQSTGGDRVRVFGLYVAPDDGQDVHNSILYVPDVTEKISYDIINEYVALGYAVLTVDLYGKREGADNYTAYPEEVAFANYERRDKYINTVPESADMSCEYVWVSVLRYGINFLEQNNSGKKIGVVGVKDGANLAWQLAAVDQRVACSVIMFGAGWSAYKGVFKYSDDDIVMDEAKRRYIAGLDAHAYAPYVKCPLLFLTSTNSGEYDFDRACDTLARVPADIECRFNFAPGFGEFLDENCRNDMRLFLRKHLFGESFGDLESPELELQQSGKYLTATVSFGGDDNVSEIKTYINSGVVNPAHRNWDVCERVSEEKGKRTYGHILSVNDTNVYAFCVVKYKNGWTVSSKVQLIHVDGITPKMSNLIYSGKNGLDGITFYSDGADVTDVFVNKDDFIVLEDCADGIKGAYSKYGLITYKFGESSQFLNEDSMLKFDVFSAGFSVIRLTLMQEKQGGVKEYGFAFEVRSGKIWQNKVVKIVDFKSQDGMSLKKYGGIYALRIEGDGKFFINNILVI